MNIGDQEKMAELVTSLNHYSYHYYVLDNPIISDKEYDALYDQLVQLEKETGIVFPDSPTQRVGDQILSAFVPHRHRERLWSLDKAQSFDELRLWDNRVSRIIGKQLTDNGLYTVEYKYDGLTINLTYEGGILVQAATRGNGVAGEGILEQVKTIRMIPLSIPFQGTVEIQGEGLMRLSVLDKYNETAEEPLKNARNAAAGALRNLNPRITAMRKLDAYFYNIGFIEGAEIGSQEEVFEFLRMNHLPVSNFFISASSISEVIRIIEDQKGQIASEDYLIDGFVVKVNPFALRQVLGYTDRFPRWAVAFKLEAQEVTTRLLDVQWNIGRTGKLTPVAILEPVEIGGVTVQRATLNNWNDILRKKIKKGCDVWLRRSNDVIPEVMGTVSECESGEVLIKPSLCPACGSHLVENGAHLFCQNSLSCEPQLIYRLAHFASRDGLDIEGFSVKTAELFVKQGLVKDIADIYSLTQEQLDKLEGFQEKRVSNLLNAIEKSKHPDLAAFLYALGIPNVGKKTAQDLAINFESLTRIMSATAEELLAIPDIGGVSAASIVQFFSDEKIRHSIARLLSYGLMPGGREKAMNRANGVFQGKTVVITGSFEKFSRRELTELVENAGGIVSNSVSKKTDYLIVGESPGSKLDKAMALEVPILHEPELITMIERM